ncbi:MAG: Cdc6/Cdc18 family protein, partial [Nostoc sp.]
SRFALESCNQFLVSHPEYQVRCIFLRGADIFEDLRIYFSEPGCHLIFVDDANRVNSFEYFIQILHDQREDQQIKVIATVRDYAFEKLKELAQSYKNRTEIELNSLDENQIKQILKDEYEILNHLYLNRIADIAQGNPRLAIMAALLAKRENRLDTINNVSNLYDEYYSSIRKDLQELGDENLLKAAGIVAFFRTVDRS